MLNLYLRSPVLAIPFIDFGKISYQFHHYGRVFICAQNLSANNCSHFRRGCERIVRIFALLFALLFVLFWSANKANNDIKWVEFLFIVS